LLTIANRALEPLDGAIEVEHQARIVELIQPRPEVHLRHVDVGQAARREQTAERLRQMQLLLQTSDGRRVRPVGNDPAMFRARSRNGCGHARKVWPVLASNKHHSPAYRSTPQPSQTSVAPLPAIALRRCNGSTVSQLAHECPRSGKTAWTRLCERMRS